MDDRLPDPRDPGWLPAPQGNLLGPVIRRDIADLNRLFVELSLEPALEEDPRFALSDRIRQALGQCGPETRERLAHSPFCLFLLRLPAAAGVADVRPPPSLDPPVAARCQSFVLLALAAGRHLAGGTPLTPRIALGLTADEEGRLAQMCPSDLARLALWPGLLRPRWPRHERVWGMLITAARTGDAALARWAHCAGLCLLDSPQDGAVARSSEPSRRRARGTRGGSGAGVPC